MISTNKTACICSSYLACQFAQKRTFSAQSFGSFQSLSIPLACYFFRDLSSLKSSPIAMKQTRVGERHIPFQAARVDIFRGYGG